MDGQGGLAERVAGLRKRLEELAPLTPQTDLAAEVARLHALNAQVQQLRRQNSQLEALLPPEAASCPTAVEAGGPARLAFKTRDLLLRGRQLLDALKALGTQIPSEPPAQDAETWCDFQQTLVLTELALRAVRTFPTETAEQVRLCSGLELCLDLAEQRLKALETRLRRQRTAEDRLDALAHYFAELIHGRSVLLKPFHDLAEQIVCECRDGQPVRWASAGVEEPARWAAAHGLNTAQIMARVVRHDHEGQRDRNAAVLAALVHDVGMAALPRELLGLPQAFGDDERRQIEAHVGIGAESVHRLAPREGWLADVILAHHERLDGTGYPKGLRGTGIPRLARLLAVCDVYAALIQPRPHRKALTPRAALAETLMEAEKGRLDADLARLLMEISFYPVGSLVELSDGRIGSVVATQPCTADLVAATRPVVRILLDSRGQPVPLPTFVNLAQCDDLHVARGLTAEEQRLALRVQTWNA